MKIVEVTVHKDVTLIVVTVNGEVKRRLIVEHSKTVYDSELGDYIVRVIDFNSNKTFIIPINELTRIINDEYRPSSSLNNRVV